MAFTPTNYMTAERALDQIATDATAYHNGVDRAIEQLQQAASNLAGMAAGWGAAVQFIDDQAAANPADDNWQSLKARKDQLVADFLSMRDSAQAVRDAAQGAR